MSVKVIRSFITATVESKEIWEEKENGKEITSPVPLNSALPNCL
jgi:hypothetical protein